MRVRKLAALVDTRKPSVSPFRNDQLDGYASMAPGEPLIATSLASYVVGSSFGIQLSLAGSTGLLFSAWIGLSACPTPGKQNRATNGKTAASGRRQGMRNR